MNKLLKITFVAFLCLLVGFSLMGCSTSGQTAKAGPDTGEVNPEDSSSPSEQQGDEPLAEGGLKQFNGVKGKVILENYPPEITRYLEENKENETQQAFNINNKTYLVLTMGQQSSAGYSIELEDLILGDGALKAVVNYQKPGKDDIVATVITYPSLVIETDDIYEGHYLIEYDIKR